MKVSKKITAVKKKPLGGAAGGGGADGGGGSGGIVWLCAHGYECMDAGSLRLRGERNQHGGKTEDKMGIENGKLEIWGGID